MPGSGAVPTMARSAWVRRLFSFGLTTSPPSLTSSVASGSLPPTSRAVSTARLKRLEYDFPIGTPTDLNSSPIAFASARPLSFSCRCLATLSRLSGSVSA